MRVTLFQAASPDAETPVERRARVLDTVVAAARDADVIVLPELWAVGFCHFDEYAAAAEPLRDGTFETCARIAAETGAWVAGGSIIERADDGTLRNTAIMVRPDGAKTVFGGHEHQLRQTLIALKAGESLTEHKNPVETHPRSPDSASGLSRKRVLPLMRHRRLPGKDL